jgi:ubiquinone/menaquinone biosynthesis C-methylase UbiE
MTGEWVMDAEAAVQEGYSRRLIEPIAEGLASQQLCEVEAYDGDFLKRVPHEIVSADFGCGNPSKYVRRGEVVLDLGSGSGKIAYILSQVVGRAGRVIGVDMNRDMVALARRHRHAFARDVGFDNMSFLLGRIQDLRTDLEGIDELLSSQPANGLDRYLEIEKLIRDAAAEQPLVPDDCVDVVVSNCVINLVRTDQKTSVLNEMYRVLRSGGRIAISDNVSDIEVPDSLKTDPQLWAKCYGGVFQEQDFYMALEKAGFNAIRIEVRRPMPKRTIGDVHFHSVTVTAVKPDLSAPCCDGSKTTRNVIYRGPWTEVTDERGNRFRRGVPTEVAGALWNTLSYSGYNDEFFRLDDEDSKPVSVKPSGGTSCCT